jgi:hypothetical protein
MSELSTPILRNLRLEQHRFGGLRWKKGWSAHPKPYPPELYRFEVSTQAGIPGDRALVTFRHAFLCTAVLYAQVLCAEETAAELMRWTQGESRPQIPTLSL